MTEVKVPGYKQNPPDWCDDCNAAPGGECSDCGCTHNCWKAGIMIELLLIAITWYLTKVFYTRDIRINWTDLGDPDTVMATCSRCSREGYIAQHNIRAPHYCMSCK
jgi:hypothetical protein